MHWKQKKSWHFDEHFRQQFWAEAKEIWKSGEKLYLEGGVLVLKLTQHVPPEEDVVIRFHIRHNLPFAVLRSQTVGCLDIGGTDVGKQMTCHKL